MQMGGIILYAFEYTIQDPIGIHARPAGQLAKLAAEFSSKVQICKGDKKVELRRLMAVMGLGIKHDETIRIEVEGEDEQVAGQKIEAFLKENL